MGGISDRDQASGSRVVWANVAGLTLYFASVDKHLKERLVGATVLVVAANILIPPMLTGPHENAPGQTELLPAGAPTESGGVKTYTIDLSAAQRKDPSAATEESVDARAELPIVEVAPAPPPDEPDASREAARSAEASAPVATSPSSSPSSSPETSTRPATSSARSPAAVNDSRTSEPTKVQGAKDPVAKDDGNWAVQVASFGVRATADRIAGELKSKGFKSYVMPVQAKGQTLYRVRVGPVEDRAAADALLKRVRTLHPSATVVTQ